MNRPLALALLLSLSACGHQDPAARLAEAKAAFAAEDYASARTAVLAALDGDRANPEMLRLLALADIMLHDGEGAGSALSRLGATGVKGQEYNELVAEAALLRGQAQAMSDILGDDASPTAWRLHGEAALADEDLATALTDFQKGMAAGEDYRLAADLARFQIDAEDIDGATASLAVMRKTGPNRLDCAMIAADIARHRAQIDVAGRILTDAIKRFPSRAEPLVALADIADIQGHPELTAQYAEQAHALAPSDPTVVALMVRVAAEKGDWTKVRDMLAPRESTLDVRSFEGMAYGEALLRLDHGEEARAIFQKALLLSPQNPYARLMLAQSQLAVHDGSGALETIRPLADSVMAGPRELDIAVSAAEMARDPSLAGYADRLHSPQLKAINAQSGQAMAAMGRRDWAAALAAWQALPGYDHDAEVLKRMATAASALGKHDAALGYATKALDLDPRNPDMLHVAGMVRLNAGRDKDVALSMLRQALERDPKNRVFRADLARAGG